MKRRWFQIHLSTAVVMMFAAGLFTEENFRARIEYNLSEAARVDLSIAIARATQNYRSDTTTIEDYCCGWPYTVFTKRSIVMNQPSMPPKTYGTMSHWTYSSLIYNMLIAIFSLLMVAVICESSIRRREARKP